MKRRKIEWEEHETQILGIRERVEEARWETEIGEEAQRLRRENKSSRGLWLDLLKSLVAQVLQLCGFEKDI